MEAPSIVIFPFENFVPAGDTEYLVDGLVDELIHQLSHLQGLRVLARHSAVRSQSMGYGPTELKSELGVSHLLTGNVRANGEYFRVTTQLTETGSGFVMASERFEKKRTDLLSLQDALAHTIADHLKLQLLPGTTPTAATESEGLGYAAYLRGRHLHNRNDPDGVTEAISCYEDAIRLSPHFAPSYAGLSRCHAFLGLRGIVNHTEGMARAREFAFRAIELDPQLEEAHLGLGEVYLYAWEWEKAAKSLRLALEINPGNALVHRVYGRYLLFVLEWEQAKKEIELALRLDPLSLEIKFALADVMMMAQDYEGAVRICRQILELQPGYRMAMNTLGYSLKMLGHLDEADEVFDEVYEILGRGNKGITALGSMYATRGEQEKAYAVIDRLRERMASEGSNSLNLDISFIYHDLGKTAESVAHLEKLLDPPHGFLPFIYRHPAWQRLWELPAFEALTAETGLIAHLEKRKAAPPAFVQTLQSDTSEGITLDLADLILVQALDNYARVVWLERGKARHKTLRITLKGLQAQLDAPFIFRCHKSFLVNTRHRFQLSGNAKGFKLRCKDWPEPIPVSRSLNQEVVDLFSKYPS